MEPTGNAEPTTPTPGLFEIIPSTPDHEELPLPATPYYVRDGADYFIHRTTRLGRVLAKMDKPPTTIPKNYDISGFIWSDFPPMPPEFLGMILSFFNGVLARQDSEAMVLLLLDDNNNWDVLIPEQDVSHGGISYDLGLVQIPEGKAHVGTIHSHCNFNAFHSTTDENDARKHDGLHITIGHIDKPEPEYAVMVSFNGILWNKNFTIHDLTKPELISPQPYPSEWLDRVHKAKPEAVINTGAVGLWNGKQATSIRNIFTARDHDYRGFDDEQDEIDRYYLQRYGLKLPDKKAPVTGFMPLDSDYSDDREIAIAELIFDLKVMRDIAANRGLNLRFKVTEPKQVSGS